VREDIADFIAESILDEVGAATSPVSGHGKFKRLSKEYKKFKRSQGGSGTRDLELTGDMLDALKVTVAGTNIKTQIGGKEGGKAEGNNDRSRFIPQTKETWNAEIMRGVARIIRASQEDE